MRILIGIIGKKGHGKDALATAIDNATDRKVVKLAFAKVLKEAAGLIFALSEEQLHGDQKEVLDPRWGKTPRELMQLFGTEVGRAIDAQVWVKSVELQAARIWEADPTAIIIVTDVRFKNEADFVLRSRGLLVRIARPEGQAGRFGDHASEQEQEGIPAHVRVENDGTLAQLDLAGRWVKWVLSRRTRTTVGGWRYVCSEEVSYSGR